VAECRLGYKKVLVFTLIYCIYLNVRREIFIKKTYEKFGGGGYLAIAHNIKNNLYKYFPETEDCKWVGGEGYLMFG
jgi:hypothetical protein